MMMPYLISVGVFLALCFLFYKLLLEKQTFFRLNRWFFIGCLAISFVLPLVPIPAQWSIYSKPGIAQDQLQQDYPMRTVETEMPQTSPIISSHSIIQTETEPSLSWTKIRGWIYYLYLFGAVVFGLNLLLQIIVLLYQVYRGNIIRDEEFRIIETKGNRAPCSFGNTIFINPANYDWETYYQILKHEKIHVKQKHSLDILMAELVLVIQWFNPFAWMLRKDLENNLEYLTDDSVLHDNNIERKGYQMNLLKVAAPHLPLGITTNYNQSLLKKRILMMNRKKSSGHSVWKYFFLLPLLTLTVCVLNKPILTAQTKPASKTAPKTAKANPAPAKASSKTSRSSSRESSHTGEISGKWSAKILKDKISIEFKIADRENWNSNTEFPISDFPNLPKSQDGEFKLTRDAGTINFVGKFDGDKGEGKFSFKVDDSYKQFLAQEGFKDFDDQEYFGCFLVNVSKDYVQMLRRNDVKDVSKDNLIALAALDVDEAYIKSWKDIGYNELDAENYITGRSLGIDRDYVAGIESSGYKHLDFEHLVSFKSLGIDKDYIEKLMRAKTGSSKNGSGMPPAEDIISFKALNIDDAFVKQFADAGYTDLSFEEMTSLKSLGITPAFIKGFEALGYKNIPVHTLESLKALDIKPSFIKGFNDLGFKDIDLDEIPGVKATGVTPEYVTNMRKKGFNSKDLNKYIELKTSFQ